MRKHRGGGALLAAALGGLVLASAPGAAASVVVLVKEAHFRLSLPAGWELSRKETKADGTYVVFLASKDRQLRLRVRAAPARGTVDLKAALASWEKKALGRNVVAFKQVKVEDKEQDGRAMRQAFYFAEMLRNRKTHVYRVINTVVLANRGFLYHVTGYVQDEQWSKRSAELIAALDSFDILPAENEVVLDTSGADVKVAPFAGKTKTVQDAEGAWKLSVPEGFVVGNFGKSQDGKRLTARIASPDRNVRIFVASKPYGGAGRYAFAAHFRRFTQRMVRKGHFDTISEIVNVRGQEDTKEHAAETRTYIADGRRNARLHSWRLMSTVLHLKGPRRVYTLTVSIAKDALAKNAGLFELLLDSFGPYDASTPSKQK